MAKKSLKKRIDDLIDALGRAEKPTFVEIRNELSVLGPLVEKLEDGQALAEKDAQIADLEAALEKSNAELGDLKVAFQKANAKLDPFLAEQKKQSEAQREIPDVQFEILERLPLVNEHGSNLDVIARGAAIPKDEAEIHLDALCKAKPALARRTTSWPKMNETAWRRTMAGNRYVVAQRLANEDGDKKTRKYPDLPKIQHTALVMMAGVPEGAYESEIAEKVGASLLLTQRNLRELRKAEMATDGDYAQATYGAGQAWWLLPKGEDYLEERGLL